MLSKDLITIITKYLSKEDILRLSSVNRHIYSLLLMKRKEILIPKLVHRCYTEGIRDGYILSTSQASKLSINGFFYNDNVTQDDTFYIGRQNVSNILRCLLRYSLV